MVSLEPAVTWYRQGSLLVFDSFFDIKQPFTGFIHDGQCCAAQFQEVPYDADHPEMVAVVRRQLESDADERKVAAQLIQQRIAELSGRQRTRSTNTSTPTTNNSSSSSSNNGVDEAKKVPSSSTASVASAPTTPLPSSPSSSVSTTPPAAATIPTTSTEVKSVKIGGITMVDGIATDASKLPKVRTEEMYNLSFEKKDSLPRGEDGEFTECDVWTGISVTQSHAKTYFLYSNFANGSR
jgi:CCR4-NOT transcriptional regulation complex NOT5 subunit